MIWVALILMAVAGACIWATCYCVNTIALALERADTDHQQCHEYTKEMIRECTADIAHLILCAAADQWDSVDEQLNIKIMAREKYVPDGPSVPAIWLRERAEQLREGFKHGTVN